MKRKDGFIMRNVGGENLLVPVGTQVIDLNGLITLNTTGAYVWELLVNECTVEELALSLSERFDTSLEHARNDIQVFIDEISGLGMLTL